MGVRGCLKKRWAISTGYDSFGFAKIRWSSRWPGLKSPVGNARRTARYASDMTDREWGLVRPFLPMPRRLGRPRTTDLREVVNALLYIATTGWQWRMLPKDFPPCSTVQLYFYEWRALGLWARINHHLVMDARELEGREASPTAGVIDSSCHFRLRTSV